MVSLWLSAGLGCGGESAVGGAAGDLPDGGSGGTGGSVQCSPGEVPLDDGTCQPAGATAGIPPEACAEGFEPDGADGCAPVLPAEPCPEGQLALPGQPACHSLGSCGAAPWGDIPVGAETQYVDGSYASGASDGSETAPWTTISEALAAAVEGGLIAIAEGHYVEDVRIDERSVRLWGRCPALVRISAEGVQPAALSIVNVPDVAVRSVSVDGSRAGIWLSHAPDAVLDTVYVANTGGIGVGFTESTTTASVHELLVEGATNAAVTVEEAEVDFDGVALRATRATSGGLNGLGLLAFADSVDGTRARVRLHRSVVEANTAVGVAAIGTDVEIEASVIRTTELEPATLIGGYGVQSSVAPTSAEPGQLHIASSLVERNRGHGVLALGADASIETTVVRDSGWQAGTTGRHWAVAWIEDVATGASSAGSIRRSVVERGHDGGVTLMGANVEVEQVVVRDTQIGELGTGRGIDATGSWAAPGRTNLRILGSRIEGNPSVGIFAAGARIELVGTAIRDTEPPPGGDGGLGIVLQDHTHTGERSAATVQHCLVEDSTICGMLISTSDAVIDSTAVLRTRSAPLDVAGYGISVQMSPEAPGDPAAASYATVRHCTIDESRDVGIGIFGSTATIEHSHISNTLGSSAGLLGDALALLPHLGQPSFAEVHGSRIERPLRAGIASFAGLVRVAATEFVCAPIPLNREESPGNQGTFEDLGGNACYCEGQGEPCRILSAGLESPEPLPL